LHTNEGSYLAHTQGKKHQTNLARRAARDMKETQLMVAPTGANAVQRKVFLKIGRPGYRVTKVRDPDTGKEGLMVQVHLPNIKEDVIPRRRFMSAWEQKREPPNKNQQYLIVRVGLSAWPLASHSLLLLRLLQSHMRLLLFGYPQEKLKMSRTTQVIGTGHTGIATPSSIASSSCSDYSTDMSFCIPMPHPYNAVRCEHRMNASAAYTQVARICRLCFY
jgi:hypothetical protein